MHAPVAMVAMVATESYRCYGIIPIHCSPPFQDICLQKNGTSQLGVTLGYDTKSVGGQLVICEVSILQVHAMGYYM